MFDHDGSIRGNGESLVCHLNAEALTRFHCVSETTKCLNKLGNWNVLFNISICHTPSLAESD